MTERDVELIESGHFSVEELHPEVSRLDRHPPTGTPWLYVVESFEVAREDHRDQVTFNDGARNYASEVFDDFGKLIDHCRRTFQITEGDFKKGHATNYPQR